MSPHAHLRSLSQGPGRATFAARGAQACLGAARREA
jgi:hypothetical protein